LRSGNRVLRLNHVRNEQLRIIFYQFVELGDRYEPAVVWRAKVVDNLDVANTARKQIVVEIGKHVFGKRCVHEDALAGIFFNDVRGSIEQPGDHIFEVNFQVLQNFVGFDPLVLKISARGNKAGQTLGRRILKKTSNARVQRRHDP